MRGTSRDRRWIALPLAAASIAVGAPLAGVTALMAVLGGASAGASCAPTTASHPLTGVPAELSPIFDAAARRYDLGARGPSILAGLTSVESNFGQNMGPSSAGAIGWTQFLPSTWEAYGVDANGDGRRDPYTAEDATFASARYLSASGAPGDWHRALFAYNPADWYVAKVLKRASELSVRDAAEDVAGPQLLVVGDSLAVGTVPELRELDLDVTSNAQEGRSSSAGVAILRRLDRSASAAVIVFDLGTNDASAAELGRSLVALTRLASGRRLVLSTVNSPFDERRKNSLLERFASRHPNVTLVRWHEESQGLDLPDGVHGGYAERAQSFADAIGAGAPTTGTCVGLVAPAGQSRRVSGGGGLVPIPGQPGQLIDARILEDVVHLIETYRLTITAGYDLTGHAANGEHPIGLALDIVPGPGSTWDDVDRLARWAEPSPGAPRPPFRWVGYDGDANHGRGHHLHLSWNHGPTPSARPPAPWVETFSAAG